MPYLEGGLTPRYVVSRADGTPCRPSARYFVLNINGDDPHAVKAAREYAESVREFNPELAADLEATLAGPIPPELAQHADAQ